MSNIGFSNIAFPVFKIGNRKPNFDQGASYFLRSEQDSDGNWSDKYQIVDDKSRPEPGLALRRLAMQAEGAKLAKLGKAIFFIGDLIKIAKPETWFIDKEGQVFQYKKSMRVPLVFKPIQAIVPMQHGGAIIAVKGIPSRFKTLFMPTPEHKYVGLLEVGNSHILYGLYDKQYDKTVRVI